MSQDCQCCTCYNEADITYGFEYQCCILKCYSAVYFQEPPIPSQQGNFSRVCQSCNETYRHLNNLYNNLEHTNALCIDLEDAVSLCIDVCNVERGH